MMKKFFILFLFISCGSFKSDNNVNPVYFYTKTECGSYEVKKDNVVIGYIVGPFWLPDYINKGKQNIPEFESKLIELKNRQYKNYYRIYTFTTDLRNDLILQVILIPTKLFKNNPNWRCEEQAVEVYWPKKKKLFSKRVKAFDYNCTKHNFSSDF